jgi:NADP-dependent 3-hydroxy acid dehydrogenase YdfG
VNALQIPDLTGRTAVVTGASSGIGIPTLAGRTAAASDPAAAKRLWTLSAELTGTDFVVSTSHEPSERDVR